MNAVFIHNIEYVLGEKQCDYFEAPSFRDVILRRGATCRPGPAR
jgi:hypothetical protein